MRLNSKHIKRDIAAELREGYYAKIESAIHSYTQPKKSTNLANTKKVEKVEKVEKKYICYLKYLKDFFIRKDS